MLNKNQIIWLKAAGARAIKTMAQTVAALLTGAVVLQELNWGYIASAAILSGVYSLVTSLAGLPEVKMNKEEM